MPFGPPRAGDVVRNAFVEGAWGEAETAGEQPFHQGKDFNLQIAVKKDRLVVRPQTQPSPPS